MTGRSRRAWGEAAQLLRRPRRLIPLMRKIVSDELRVRFEHRNLYSYATTRRFSEDALNLLVRWILSAQRADGGIAAYYSLLTGYSASYPEVTGYIIPTLYDFANWSSEPDVIPSAEKAVNWLLSLQMPSGAFPGGLHGAEAQASVFNTGQILQGLVRAYRETNRAEIRKAGIAVGDWLLQTQQPDGSWSGPGAYQGVPHTYYSMVSWALAKLSEHTADRRYALAAEKNLDWGLPHLQHNGWIDGINLSGHPIYLHFIAYALQGVLETGALLRRTDAFGPVERSARVFLRKFETGKFLPGAYDSELKNGRKFSCLTGNAQMSCVWLRLYELTGDARYLNAALKMNEMLKESISLRGKSGIAGGVSGSLPIWGPYQPFRYISWGAKFFVDALLLEQRITRSFTHEAVEALPCAS